MPYDVTLFWHQYPWLLGKRACQSRALISETASNVSVLTVVTFSTERYLAICHPLYKLAITSLQRARRIIIALWLISLACAMPFAVNSDVHFISYPENGTYRIPARGSC
ncbi:unnamed protein product [Acanthoscelides obtectus]|uniref:G-protein coupled receptors family 1 profile domain-containing protein n=1 Tax=Acanthoscelides obtectus TaxID=200917 RepID=A0A9P0LMF8_ACAOB|nr:unnamed protein product [Acanthoscelides obtectus]CAK1646615.1 Neuropeptides capa receptor [Acanthoscelides obtectus]